MNNSIYLPNDTILNGKYLVKKPIGSGGFGITYIATVIAESKGGKEKYVAIKEYFPSSVVTRVNDTIVQVKAGCEKEYKRWKENYELEFQLISKLTDNNAIPRFYEPFSENNTSYLVMDYIRGSTIQDLVKSKGPLAVEKVLNLLYDFLPELAKMNQEGIMHRDINPSNIILTNDGNLKLIDFGNARPIPQKGGRMTVLLAPGYAPPEQYKEYNTNQGPQTDVYGLCASIYYGLTGIVPPDGLQRAKRDELIPIQQKCTLPDQMARAITHGLAPRLEDRTRDFYVLHQELFSSFVKSSSKIREKPEDQKIVTGGGRSLSFRMNAACRAAGVMRHFSPIKAKRILARIDEIGRMPNTAEKRVTLEECIYEQGRCFNLVCALFMRKNE